MQIFKMATNSNSSFCAVSCDLSLKNTTMILIKFILKYTPVFFRHAVSTPNVLIIYQITNMCKHAEAD